METWKPVFYKGISYEGHYAVSNKGRVMSFKRGDNKILSQSISGGGKIRYYKVILSMGSKRVYGKVHRLVYESFKGEVKDGFVIHHMDSNSFNNSLSNLVQISSRQNQSIERTIKSKLPTGVSISASLKYVAVIRFSGRNLYLGAYLTVSSASEAYKIALKAINNKCSLLKIQECIDCHRQSVNLKPIKRRYKDDL